MHGKFGLLSPGESEQPQSGATQFSEQPQYGATQFSEQPQYGATQFSEQPQYGATQFSLFSCVQCFRVSVFHRILTWTT